MLLTLDHEACAAVQVPHHGAVLPLLAVVYVLHHQLVRLLLRQHPVAAAGLQLHAAEHPLHGDVVLGETELENGGRAQQGGHVLRLLQDLNACGEQSSSFISLLHFRMSNNKCDLKRFKK